MTELLTSAQMRAIETAAIASGQATGLALMERAGAGVVEAILEAWPALGAFDPARRRRAVLLCGPGNNGGDGFVVARLLQARGWAVTVLLFGDPERLPPDARANHDRWCRIGGVQPFPGAAAPAPDPAPDLWVDAIFGIGQTRRLPEPVAALLERVRAARATGAARLVAVDLPTGLCADTGRALDPDPVTADLTVTFHRPKIGHVLADGPTLCGRLAVKAIGLPPLPAPDPTGGARVCSLAMPIAAVAKAGPGHKYDHGHALVLSGGMGRSGAARLAARGALRVGAGLVTVAAPGAALLECAAHLTAIMLRRCDDGADLAALLEDPRIAALCLGPGLGGDARAAGLVESALQHPLRGGCVLDADALTVLAQRPDPFRGLDARCVLTPHGGEFARLFPDIAARLAAPVGAGPATSRVDAVREAAARAGCVVLLKGPDTVIADPSGRCAVHAAVYDRAVPWLATAGAGDVLAGMIAGLLARGLAPMQAAGTAAWLHVEAARAFGPGLIAEDLPEQVPGVLRALGA